MTSRVCNFIAGHWHAPLSSHVSGRPPYDALIVRVLAAISVLLLYGCGGSGGMEINASYPAINTARNPDVVASKPFSFGRDSAARSRLVLYGVNGNIVVNGAPAGSGIAVNGEREVGSDSLADAQSQLEQLDVEIEEIGTDIVIRTVQPANSGGRRYTVNYRVQIPVSFTANIVNVNGSVEVDGIAGNVDTRVVNGRIDATLAPSASSAIKLVAENGDISLRLAPGTSAALSAETTLGAISLTDLSLQNEVRTSTQLQGTFGTGTGTVFLKTVNGSIRIDDLT